MRNRCTPEGGVDGRDDFLAARKHDQIHQRLAAGERLKVTAASQPLTLLALSAAHLSIFSPFQPLSAHLPFIREE